MAFCTVCRALSGGGTSSNTIGCRQRVHVTPWPVSGRPSAQRPSCRPTRCTPKRVEMSASPHPGLWPVNGHADVQPASCHHRSSWGRSRQVGPATTHARQRCEAQGLELGSPANRAGCTEPLLSSGASSAHTRCALVLFLFSNDARMHFWLGPGESARSSRHGPPPVGRSGGPTASREALTAGRTGGCDRGPGLVVMLPVSAGKIAQLSERLLASFSYYSFLASSSGPPFDVVFPLVSSRPVILASPPSPSFALVCV